MIILESETGLRKCRPGITAPKDLNKVRLYGMDQPEKCYLRRMNGSIFKLEGTRSLHTSASELNYVLCVNYAMGIICNGHKYAMGIFANNSSQTKTNY
jgi:hypothetical protein